MNKFLLLVILLATPPLSQAQDETARRAAGCGPNDIQFEVKTDKKQHPKGELASGKALVYVFDDRGGVGIGWPPVRIGVDGTWVGANFKASYFFFSVIPGDHNLCSSVKGPLASMTNVSLLATTFTAEAGQIYYFEILPPHNSRAKLREIAPAQAELQIGKLPFCTFTQKPASPPDH